MGDARIILITCIGQFSYLETTQIDKADFKINERQKTLGGTSCRAMTFGMEKQKERQPSLQRDIPKI
jgi:hypothetical protein